METITRRGWFARIAGALTGTVVWPKGLAWPQVPRPWSVYDHYKRRMVADAAVGSHAWQCEKVSVRLINGSEYELRTLDDAVLQNGETLTVTMSSSGHYVV